MANSRLYIYDPETESAVMIAKTMGGGWYTWGEDTAEAMDTFFDSLDDNRGYGTPKETTLTLLTEYELPKDTNVLERKCVKVTPSEETTGKDVIIDGLRKEVMGLKAEIRFNEIEIQNAQNLINEYRGEFLNELRQKPYPKLGNKQENE